MPPIIRKDTNGSINHNAPGFITPLVSSYYKFTEIKCTNDVSLRARSVIDKAVKIEKRIVIEHTFPCQSRRRRSRLILLPVAL